MNSELLHVLLDERCFELAEGKLVGNRCRKCNHRFFPVREFCPNCLSSETMESFEIPDKGILYSYTTIHTGPARFGQPYTVGYADIHPELRLFGHIRSFNGRMPKINDRVEIKLGKVGEQDRHELWGVVFEPVEQEAGK